MLRRMELRVNQLTETPQTPDLCGFNVLQRRRIQWRRKVSRKLFCLSAEEKHKKEMFGKTLGGSSFAVVQQLCCFSFAPTVS